jgi:hypothetical protein
MFCRLHQSIIYDTDASHADWQSAPSPTVPAKLLVPVSQIKLQHLVPSPPHTWPENVSRTCSPLLFLRAGAACDLSAADAEAMGYSPPTPKPYLIHFTHKRYPVPVPSQYAGQ